MLHLSVDVAHDCEFLQLFRLLSHEVLLPLSSEVIPPSLRSLCPCQAMSVLQVKNRLCLQDMAVAFEKEGCKLDVVDPYNLAWELDIDPDVPLSSVSIVSFKGTGNLQWLEKGLELKARWWVSNHHRVPLILQILALINDKKPKKTSSVLLPRNQKCVLPLDVRGKILWFENNSRCVNLALQEGHEIEQLLWFLDELKKDIDEHVYSPEPEGQKEHTADKWDVPAMQHIVVEMLEDLQGHQSCRAAAWLPSRCSFHVRRSDKKSKQFRVQDLNKKYKESVDHDDTMVLKRQFEQAVAKAKTWLEEPPVPSEEASTQELPGVLDEPAYPADTGPSSRELADQPAEPAELVEPAVPAPAVPAEPAELAEPAKKRQRSQRHAQSQAGASSQAGGSRSCRKSSRPSRASQKP